MPLRVKRFRGGEPHRTGRLGTSASSVLCRRRSRGEAVAEPKLSGHAVSSTTDCRRDLRSEAGRLVLGRSYSFLEARDLCSEQGQKYPASRERNFRGIIAAAHGGCRETSFFSPLVQASAPRTVRGLSTSATLGKPLSREFLFYRSGKLLSKSSGSGLCVAREPRLPRNHA